MLNECLLQVIVEFLELDKHPHHGLSIRKVRSDVSVLHFNISTLGLHIFSKVPPGDGGSAEGATTEKEGFAEARR